MRSRGPRRRRYGGARPRCPCLNEGAGSGRHACPARQRGSRGRPPQWQSRRESGHMGWKESTHQLVLCAKNKELTSRRSLTQPSTAFLRPSTNLTSVLEASEMRAAMSLVSVSTRARALSAFSWILELLWDTSTTEASTHVVRGYPQRAVRERDVGRIDNLLECLVDGAATATGSLLRSGSVGAVRRPGEVLGGGWMAVGWQAVAKSILCHTQGTYW